MFLILTGMLQGKPHMKKCDTLFSVKTTDFGRISKAGERTSWTSWIYIWRLFDQNKTDQAKFIQEPPLLCKQMLLYLWSLNCLLMQVTSWKLSNMSWWDYAIVCLMFKNKLSRCMLICLEKSMQVHGVYEDYDYITKYTLF